MSIIDFLTPKDTEEIKPGLFVQKGRQGYKVIQPLAWNGQLKIKEQLRSVFSLRTFITIGIILFLAWSYSHDIKGLNDFRNEVVEDPVAFCEDIYRAYEENPCSERDEELGLCDQDFFTSTYNKSTALLVYENTNGLSDNR